LEGKSIGLDPKKTKKRAQRRELMIWRTKMWARVQDAIQCRFGDDCKLPMCSYCRQYKISVKSFLWLPIFLPIFLTNTVSCGAQTHLGTAQTHIGSMLCTFWDCNGTKTLTDTFQEQNVHNRGAKCVETKGEKRSKQILFVLCAIRLRGLNSA
jgi:hypothetical protein